MGFGQGALLFFIGGEGGHSTRPLNMPDRPEALPHSVKAACFEDAGDAL